MGFENQVIQMDLAGFAVSGRFLALVARYQKVKFWKKWGMMKNMLNLKLGLLV